MKYTIQYCKSYIIKSFVGVKNVISFPLSIWFVFSIKTELISSSRTTRRKFYTHNPCATKLIFANVDKEIHVRNKYK